MIQSSLLIAGQGLVRGVRLPVLLVGRAGRGSLTVVSVRSARPFSSTPPSSCRTLARSLSLTARSSSATLPGVRQGARDLDQLDVVLLARTGQHRERVIGAHLVAHRRSRNRRNLFRY